MKNSTKKISNRPKYIQYSYVAREVKKTRIHYGRTAFFGIIILIILTYFYEKNHNNQNYNNIRDSKQSDSTEQKYADTADNNITININTESSKNTEKNILTSSKIVKNNESHCNISQYPKKISIIISGLGLNNTVLNEALSLPNNVCLGISPYSYNLTQILEHAEKKGFTTLIQIPIQDDYSTDNDAGQYALNKNQSIASNTEKLLWILSNLKNIRGYVYLDKCNEMEYSKDTQDMINQLIIPYLQERKISLVEWGNFYNHGIKKIDTDSYHDHLKQLNIYQFDVFIDLTDNVDYESTKKKLDRLLNDSISTTMKISTTASQLNKQHIIALIHPNSSINGIKNIKKWINDFEQEQLNKNYHKDKKDIQKTQIIAISKTQKPN